MGAAGSVGIRTVEGTAKEVEDFRKVDVVIKFKKGQEEAVIRVPIIDDDEYEPDKEFYCELYDQRSGFMLKGKDTRCTIIIIDDDKPGCLSFEKT